MRRLFVNSNLVFRLVSFMVLITLGTISIVGSGGGDDITGGGVTLSRIDVAPSVVPKDLLPGLEQQFVAIGTYSNGSQEILGTGLTWTSSTPGVANVNASGIATGVSAGTTDITASMSNITSNAVALTVAEPNLLSIQVSPPTVSNGLPVEASQQFIAIGVYDNNQVYEITDSVDWNSSDTNVATIDANGVAAGVAAGSANISASTTTPAVTSNSVSVGVSVQTADALVVEPQESVPLPIDRTIQLTALLKYNNNTTFDVTDEVQWTSNDPSVASVSDDVGSKGLVTGLSTGRVTITANHSLTGNLPEAVFDVTSATIQSVDISPASPSDIPVEHTENFIVTGLFSDGVSRQLTAPNWFINDSSIATFSYRGTTAQVLGVAAGSANLIYLDTLADGMLSGQSDTIPITITDAVLDTVTINPTPTATIPDDSQLGFTASGNFDDGSSRDITQDVFWITGDNTIAGFSVLPGELTALSNVANASTTAQALRVNSQDVLKTSPTTTVNVHAATVTGLIINEPAPVTVWETDQYTVTATFDNGSTADYTELVTWSVDPATEIIAVVSTANGTKGQVTGVRAGPATLRVVLPNTTISQFRNITIGSP